MPPRAILATVQVVARPPLVRATHDGVVLGVAAGLADHLGLDRRWVRAAFALAALFGVGIVVYLAAALLVPGDDGTPALATRWRPRDGIDVAAFAAIAIGTLTLGRELAPSGPEVIGVPVVVSALALAVLVSWPAATASSSASDLPDVPAWLPPGTATALGVLRTRRGLLVRALVGGVLVVAGTVALLAAASSWSQLRDGVLAVAVVGAGIALVVGPWLGRLATELSAERRERIRNQERAEMAAHLHDSVLQTLALVQRRADDSSEVVRLARRQERELRQWLLTGRIAGTPAESFTAELDAYAAQLEDTNGVAVEVVHVRDCPLDDRLRAVALAAREAIANAQRHAGVRTVSVYSEVDEREVRVYVRDRGVGFDRAHVPADRGGVAESIEGRMRRHGGRATIRTAPGAGTEVELAMPRRATS